MKNRFKKKKSEYTQLKVKLLVRFVLTGAGALTILLSLYNFLWYRRGADFLVGLFQRTFKVTYEEALNMYQQAIRNNAELIWNFTMLLIFMILLTLVLNWFVRYFDMVSKGIRSLLDENAEIQLPPEMQEIERILTAVKTELRQRRLEAQLAEQRKNELVMYLAHDIRTPLTSVIGYLSLLEEVPDMPTEQKAKYVHITLEKAYRLEKMINEFFEITRYNLQHIEISKEPIDLYYMMVQLLDELSPVLSSHGNTTVLEADENLTVYGDPDKLARVFNNVLKNAAAYSYPNTEILISAEEKVDSVIIIFQNKGRTIPKEKLSSLFEKFYRLDESRASNTGGSGLGLAIAKEIVHLHGGTITAESENETITFRITLPISI